MTHDSRRYHRASAPERVRFYGKQQSSTQIKSPFGGLPTTVAGRVSRQAVSPLLLGLGTGQGRAAQKLNQDITSGAAGGPLASVIRQLQQFAPGVMGQGTAAGNQQAQQGTQAVQQQQGQIQQALAALPQYQSAVNSALGGANNALGLAQNAARGPALTDAQAASARAQQLLGGGQAQDAAGSGVSAAQNFLQQQSSPIAGEDLYQTAARRVMQQVNPQMAARGLEGSGSGAQMLTEANMNLAATMAQNQAQNRQAALQGVTGATGNLAGIQQGAISGAGQAAGNVGNIQQQGLTGIENAATNVGNLAQGGAGMSSAGVGLAGQNVGAVQQLGQFLQSQYGIPMQAAGGLLNMLTGGVSPGLQLTQATAPIGAPSSKGTNIL
jgi:hypothetical protein